MSRSQKTMRPISFWHSRPMNLWMNWLKTITLTKMKLHLSCLSRKALLRKVSVSTIRRAILTTFLTRKTILKSRLILKLIKCRLFIKLRILKITKGNKDFNNLHTKRKTWMRQIATRLSTMTITMTTTASSKKQSRAKAPWT